MGRSNLFAKEDTSRDPLSERVIGAAIEVHRTLGPGLLESTYRDCLEYEIRECGLSVARDAPMTIQYKTLRIPNGYKIDLLVERELIIEIKEAVEHVLWVHEAQLLTYLRMSGIKRGLLLNFNVPLLKDGITRMVY